MCVNSRMSWEEASVKVSPFFSLPTGYRRIGLKGCQCGKIKEAVSLYHCVEGYPVIRNACTGGLYSHGWISVVLSHWDFVTSVHASVINTKSNIIIPVIHCCFKYFQTFFLRFPIKGSSSLANFHCFNLELLVLDMTKSHPKSWFRMFRCRNSH